MGQIVRVPLGDGKFAIIDAIDAERVLSYSWSAQRRPKGGFYAYRYEGGYTIYMHRAIAGTPDDMDTDHWDRDGLNNRRKNLRIATRTQNNANHGLQSNSTTGYKGVTFAKDKKKYQAQIRVNGRNKFLGYHHGPYSAAIAYDEAALRYFGEFADLNFPAAEYMSRHLDLEQTYATEDRVDDVSRGFGRLG